jgi:hypothetical protein
MLMSSLIRRWLSSGTQAQVYVKPAPLILDATVRDTVADQVIKIMVSEVADLTRAMRELLMTADRFINLAGLIVGATLSLGLVRHGESNNWLILVFAPFGLVLVFGYLIQIYTEVEKRAGYKQYLEGRINAMLAAPILLESSVNDHSNRQRKSVFLMQILNGIGFLGLSVLSVHETWTRFSGNGPAVFGIHILNWNAANIVCLIFAVVVIVAAGRENLLAADRARKAAVQAGGVRVVTSP